MKKLLIWIGSFLGLIILTVVLTSPKGAKTLEELVANKKDFFLVIGADFCSFCQEYKKETLNYYSESEMGAPLVEVDWFKISEEEQESMKSTYGIEVEVTPTTYFFKDGILKEAREGVLTMSDLKEMKK